MKIISWNCRGLGNPTAVRALKKLLKTQCPDLVFLMETRLKADDKKAKSTLVCGPLSIFFN
jgi:exonuclease III